MQTQTISITQQDLERLRELIRDSRAARSESYETLQALERELDQAQVVEQKQIPADVITMNSTVVVQQVDRRREQRWTIVYPEHADFDEGRISILAPLGTALMGYRVGDEFEWQMPAGLRRYRIKAIEHQPEAAGEWDR